jgi:hypothetical protein
MQRVTWVIAAAMLAVGLVSSSWVGQAQAGLNFLEAHADAALSIDGLGQTGNNGSIQTNVPAGATILQAYMYVTTVWDFSGFTDVTLSQGGNSVTLPAAGGTLLSNANPSQVRRHDVTSFVSANIAAGLQNWTVNEANTGQSDGTILVVAYRHAATTTGATAIIMDGELALAGDSTTLGFAPYSGGAVVMSLASEFSFQPTGQVTLIDVTTSSNPVARRLSGCAGGQDDGAGANGALITVGGIGDSTANPNPACTGAQGPLVDDELYDLAQGNSADADPFLSAGDTSITLITSNPSNDDNVFFLGFTAGFRVTDVDDVSTDVPSDDAPTDDTPTDDTPSVPAPATLLLLGLGLVGAAIARRR